jgi:hypothetical protein
MATGQADHVCAEDQYPCPVGAAANLPDEMVADQLRRVSIFVAVTGAVDLRPVRGHHPGPDPLPQFARKRSTAQSIEVAGVLVSAAVWLYLRFVSLAPHPNGCGTCFMVATAAGSRCSITGSRR